MGLEQAQISTSSSLSDLLIQLKAVENIDFDRRPGKRSSSRHRPFPPFEVRLQNRSGTGRTLTTRLRDLSENGIGIILPYPLAPLERVWVEVTIGTTCWSGWMVVIHITQTIGGYKTGLGLLEPHGTIAATGRRLDPPILHPDPEWLQDGRQQILQLIRPWRLGYLTHGIFGISLPQIIRQIMAPFSSEQQENADALRRAVRRHEVEAMACAVLPVPGKWRGIPVRMEDVSHGGAGLKIPIDPLIAWDENEWAGGLVLRPEMTLVIGLGEGDELIWLPTRIVHCGREPDQPARVGVTFLPYLPQEYLPSDD